MSNLGLRHATADDFMPPDTVCSKFRSGFRRKTVHRVRRMTDCLLDHPIQFAEIEASRIATISGIGLDRKVRRNEGKLPGLECCPEVKPLRRIILGLCI